MNSETVLPKYLDPARPILDQYKAAERCLHFDELTADPWHYVDFATVAGRLHPCDLQPSSTR